MAQAKKALKHNTRNKASKKYVKKSNLRKTKKSVKRRTYRKRTIKGGSGKEMLKNALAKIENLLINIKPIKDLDKKNYFYKLKYRLIRLIKKKKKCADTQQLKNFNSQKKQVEEGIIYPKEVSDNQLEKDCYNLDKKKEETKHHLGDNFTDKFERFRMRHDTSDTLMTSPGIVANALYYCLNIIKKENNSQEVSNENNNMLCKLLIALFFCKSEEGDKILLNSTETLKNGGTDIIKKIKEILFKSEFDDKINEADIKETDTNKEINNIKEKAADDNNIEHIDVNDNDIHNDYEIYKKYIKEKFGIENTNDIENTNKYLSKEEFGFLLTVNKDVFNKSSDVTVGGERKRTCDFNYKYPSTYVKIVILLGIAGGCFFIPIAGPIIAIIVIGFVIAGMSHSGNFIVSNPACS